MAASLRSRRSGRAGAACAVLIGRDDPAEGGRLSSGARGGKHVQGRTSKRRPGVRLLLRDTPRRLALGRGDLAAGAAPARRGGASVSTGPPAPGDVSL